MARLKFLFIILVLFSMALVACENMDDNNPDDTNDNEQVETTPTDLPPLVPPDGEMVRVVRVIDGDTIDVDWQGETFRVRYIGVNTPESDEACYDRATQTNRNLVDDQIVRLYSDVSDTDRFDRLLRYVYLGNTHVNELLVELGFAEVVSYPPDTEEFENFRALEQQAASEGLGCHPTGIFDDNTYER